MRASSRLLTIAGLIIMLPAPLHGDSAIDVQRRSAADEHLAALATFDRLPRRVISPEARIAAARSAWALGLSGRALAEFDRALADDSLSAAERTRIELSKGIIHFQEGRFQVALVHAEKAANGLAEAGPLRSKAWLLWAESLSRTGSYGLAEGYYQKALDEAAPEERAEIHFLLGECQRPLGKFDAARENFEKVPLRHVRTAEAMRNLAEVALEMKNYSSVSFWLKRGRDEYPDNFLDSWTDYALVRAAIHAGATDEVRDLRGKAQSKYAPSDGWLTLLNAESEAYEWQVLRK